VNATSIPAILTGIFMGIVAPYALAFAFWPMASAAMGLDIPVDDHVRQVLQAAVLLSGPVAAGFLAGKLAPGQPVLHGFSAGAIATVGGFALLKPQLAQYAAIIFLAGGAVGGWLAQWYAVRGKAP